MSTKVRSSVAGSFDASVASLAILVTHDTLACHVFNKHEFQESVGTPYIGNA